MAAIQKKCPANFATESGSLHSGKNGIFGLLKDIHDFPMLSAEQEIELIRDLRESGCSGAADKLVSSHLRLVAKIASGYKGYGLALEDLISEGVVGLMKAIPRFNPDFGYRFSSYATNWIRAEIQEYILKTCSLVRIGKTNSLKKLFFKLRKVKSQMKLLGDTSLRPEEISAISARLGVSEADVLYMNDRLSADILSLNTPVLDGSREQWQDRLVDGGDSQEEILSGKQETANRRKLLSGALKKLSERERRILSGRKLKNPPTKLEAFGREYGITIERVRQIENESFGKIQKWVVIAARNKATQCLIPKSGNNFS